MLIKTLNEAFERDEDWTVNHYHAIHKPSGMSFWIANGWMSFQIENGPGISFWTKICCWPNLIKMKERKIAKSLEMRGRKSNE